MPHLIVPHAIIEQPQKLRHSVDPIGMPAVWEEGHIRLEGFQEAGFAWKYYTAILNLRSLLLGTGTFITALHPHGRHPIFMTFTAKFLAQHRTAGHAFEYYKIDVELLFQLNDFFQDVREPYAISVRI